MVREMAVAKMLAANLGWEQPVEYEDLFIEAETNEGSLNKAGFCCQHRNAAEKMVGVDIHLS